MQILQSISATTSPRLSLGLARHHTGENGTKSIAKTRGFKNLISDSRSDKFAIATGRNTLRPKVESRLIKFTSSTSHKDSIWLRGNNIANACSYITHVETQSSRALMTSVQNSAYSYINPLARASQPRRRIAAQEAAHPALVEGVVGVV